jgi:hypothetical protein
MEDYLSIGFKNIDECCYITEKFDKCNGITVKNSFFCGKHKSLLFKLNEFKINHAGNIKKIIDTNIIKSAKDAKVKGSGVHSTRRPFSQVFFTIIFPKFKINSYGSRIDEKRGIKENEAGELFLKPSILNILAKKGADIDFTDHLAMGDCIERLCIQYNKDFSTRENLNRFYHFLVFCQYFWFLYTWKNSKKPKMFNELKTQIFEEVENEMRIYQSVPLIIDGKNYLEDYIFY